MKATQPCLETTMEEGKDSLSGGEGTALRLSFFLTNLFPELASGVRNCREMLSGRWKLTSALTAGKFPPPNPYRLVSFEAPTDPITPCPLVYILLTRWSKTDLVVVELCGVRAGRRVSDAQTRFIIWRETSGNFWRGF